MNRVSFSSSLFLRVVILLVFVMGGLYWYLYNTSQITAAPPSVVYVGMGPGTYQPAPGHDKLIVKQWIGGNWFFKMYQGADAQNFTVPTTWFNDHITRVWSTSGPFYADVPKLGGVRIPGTVPPEYDYGIYDAGVVDDVGCTVEYVILDDDPDEDATKIFFELNGNLLLTLEEETLVQSGTFVVGNTGELTIKTKESVGLYYLDVCPEVVTPTPTPPAVDDSVTLKGVFISTAAKESSGVGSSGFEFNRDITSVPAGKAPYYLEYDAKYLVDFRDLLGEALVDWVEVRL